MFSFFVSVKVASEAAPGSPGACKEGSRDSLDQIYLAEMKKLQFGKYCEVLLNFRTPENFAVIYQKFKQKAQTLGYFVKKMQME